MGRSITVKSFYNNYKNLISDRVIIIHNDEEVYSGYMSESRVSQYLFDYVIEDIYIGVKDDVVVKLKDTEYEE